ncbi:MAG: nuclear transport factor 2 family protein [Woeseiaceae bacterium]|nr:nuclear transport factor 2 family protein [Woeseiaceae bacterium]
MKNSLVAAAMLSCVGLLAGGAIAGEHAADVAELTEKKMIVWPKLYAERDAAGLATFLADGFKVLEPDGAMRTKAEEIAWLAETPPDDKQSDFVFTIEEILFPSKDLAIVYGHGDSTREADDGKPCHHNYWSSNTFIRQGGVWKPVFSHVSGITCKPID